MVSAGSSRARARIKVEIGSLVAGGDGLARVGGQAVFVPGAAPGDRLEVAITDRHKTYARARIVEVLQPGPDRVAPPCPVFGRCGGCQWQHLTYEAQLRWKREIVRDAFKRLARMDVEVAEVVPSPNPWRYRHKTAVPLGVGFYAHGSHEIVPFEECLIQHPLLDRIVAAVRELGLPPYDERTHTGLLRHVVARCNLRGDQAVVALVVTDPRVEAASLMQRIPELRGVVANINTTPGNAILGDRSVVLAGENAITEEVDGLRFEISAESFFQVNPAAAAALHRMAAEAAQAAGAGGTALDLYAGVGSIALRLAGGFDRVTAVEISAAACRDAERNAALNGITNVRFVHGRVEDLRAERADVVVLDPPRKGAGAEVIAAVAGMRPGRIVYVSCDPATLARDARALADAGWAPLSAVPLDMFPQTAHVETVAAFGRA
ncbi:MAG TPA: 23S rRNA (uracil(1939)-C(5))-methyltransferase RlmD [Bacillota bacterium]|nr:23S rRNA (uracil(1939)-C(5))-methyltransferase RlmD [Bacillota bacterium]